MKKNTIVKTISTVIKNKTFTHKKGLLQAIVLLVSKYYC